MKTMVHVGMPRAASTYLQYCVFPYMAEHYCWVPFEVFSDAKAHGYDPAILKRDIDRNVSPTHAATPEWERIISHEHFSVSEPAQEAVAKAYPEAVVLVITRPPRKLLWSYYLNHLSIVYRFRSANYTFDEWLHWIDGKGLLDVFVRQDSVIERLGGLWGEGNVVAYEIEEVNEFPSGPPKVIPTKSRRENFMRSLWRHKFRNNTHGNVVPYYTCRALGHVLKHLPYSSRHKALRYFAKGTTLIARLTVAPICSWIPPYRRVRPIFPKWFNDRYGQELGNENE